MRNSPHAASNVRGILAALLAVLAALLAACAGTPVDDSEPLSRSCPRSNCFFERNVRDFEVVDQTRLLVYVGAQRCPYVVEVDGMFCDLTFSSMVRFRGGESRVCAYDRTWVESDPFARPEERCRLRDVRSITDNELVELLVDRGAAPPAPVGSGEISVEEGEAAEAADASAAPDNEPDAEEGDAAPPAN